ncbi:MAG TPA: sensor histidine kinase [Clostridiales bacterium]|nr:sensor histidine kinase [Clostridiales bacterium]
MKELSLNILDISMNSVKAKADTIHIAIIEDEHKLSIEIADNGCGMKEDFLKNVTNPFSTTRTTRKVGLGLPFFKLAAEQTGGYMNIESKHIDNYTDNHGTKITAVFIKDSIDFTPLGDIISTVITLIQGSPNIRWIFRHNNVHLDTAELVAVLGDVPLDVPEVLAWITDYLKEQYSQNL